MVVAQFRILAPGILPKLPAAVILLLWAWSFVHAQSLPAVEKQKIEELIQQVSALQHARFIRNGSSYSAASAAIFLRRKWQANDSRVKTARDFIAKVASFSGTSGKPYLIRFQDGREIKSQEFLLGELSRLENPRAELPASGG